MPRIHCRENRWLRCRTAPTPGNRGNLFAEPAPTIAPLAGGAWRSGGRRGGRGRRWPGAGAGGVADGGPPPGHVPRPPGPFLSRGPARPRTRRGHRGARIVRTPLDARSAPPPPGVGAPAPRRAPAGRTPGARPPSPWPSRPPRAGRARRPTRGTASAAQSPHPGRRRWPEPSHWGTGEVAD